MIQLSFTVHLERYDLEDILQPNGPLFHRWLPNGRSDSVVIHSDGNNTIEVWFERRGKLDEGFIKYDRNSFEVDEGVMVKQGHLDAGQLWGEASIDGVTEEQIAALEENAQNTAEFKSLGKKVINFLYDPLSNFINMLRTQYGQYWLLELSSWDSRDESQGSYCSTTLWLEWREKSSDEWKPFSPTDHSITFTVPRLPGRQNAEYLTQEDWKHIQETKGMSMPPLLALEVFSRAHELLDRGHSREAFVGAVTALEIAIEHYFTDKTESLSDEGGGLAKRLLSMPLKTQISILICTASVAPLETLDDVIEVIDARNEIVHDGKKALDSNNELFLSIRTCITGLLQLNDIKTPVLYSGNSLTEPELGGNYPFGSG
jgi:hypothetical protein